MNFQRLNVKMATLVEISGSLVDNNNVFCHLQGMGQSKKAKKKAAKKAAAMAAAAAAATPVHDIPPPPPQMPNNSTPQKLPAGMLNRI